MSRETNINLELTDEQRSAYLKNPFHCPFCGSSHILGGDIDAGDGATIWKNVSCGDCDAYWTEEYTITGIHNEAVV